MTRHRPNKKKMLHFFIVISGLAAIFLMAYFLPSQKSIPLHVAAIKPMNKEATISFSGVRHTAYQKGIKEWLLKADTVDYINENKKAHFHLLKISFFQKKGTPITVTADKGVWQTNSNDLEVTGNVVIKNKPYEMLTEKLRYHHSTKKFIADTPVRITGNSLNLSSKTMIYDLNTNQIYLDDQVEGTIAKNINI